MSKSKWNVGKCEILKIGKNIYSSPTAADLDGLTIE